MNAGPDVERQISGWLHEEAPGRAPDRILEAAGRTIDRTRQRRFVAGWRDSMSGLRGLAAAAAIGTLVVAGAFYVTRPSLGPGDQPTPSAANTPTASPVPGVQATAEPSRTPDPAIMGAFRTARDSVCIAAAAEADPLKERFVGIFDGSITPAQRDDWVTALEAFASIQGDAIEEIAALAPPAEIASANADNITIFRDMNARILLIATHLRAGADASAREVDNSTNHLNDLISDYEVRNGLVRCP